MEVIISIDLKKVYIAATVYVFVAEYCRKDSGT